MRAFCPGSRCVCRTLPAGRTTSKPLYVRSSLLDMDEGVRSALDGFSHAQLAQQLQDCASRLFSQPGELQVEHQPAAHIRLCVCLLTCALLHCLFTAGLRRAGLPPRARLLFAAADGGDTAVLQLMLLLLGPEEAAAAVDASSSTALHYAARQGQHGAVRLLLAHSTREAACARNREGSTPLALAAAGGHGEAVQALLGAAREAVATADGQQRMPLALAARGGHAHVMRLLLAAVPPEAVPALVARCDAHRYTPLHEACSQHYATAVSLLLDAAGDTAGALCKMQTRPSGFTPLHLAVRLTLRTVPEASAAVAQLLVAACPLACMTADAQGMLPLHRSVLDANTAVLPLLLEAGPEAATEAAPQHGTPLEMALATKRPHIARCLLAAGPAAHVFNILLSAACAPAVRRSLLPDAIVARMPLSEADWALVPFRHKTEVCAWGAAT